MIWVGLDCWIRRLDCTAIKGFHLTLRQIWNEVNSFGWWQLSSIAPLSVSHFNNILLNLKDKVLPSFHSQTRVLVLSLKNSMVCLFPTLSFAHFSHIIPSSHPAKRYDTIPLHTFSTGVPFLPDDVSNALPTSSALQDSGKKLLGEVAFFIWDDSLWENWKFYNCKSIPLRICAFVIWISHCSSH